VIEPHIPDEPIEQDNKRSEGNGNHSEADS
jgi:hypothetical protein